MNTRTLILLAALVGLIVGWVSAHGIGLVSAIVVLPWGVVGGVIGASTRSRSAALWAGAVYGITLTAAFLFGGFSGTQDQFGGLVLLVALLSVIGALGGLVTAFVGNWLRARFWPMH